MLMLPPSFASALERLRRERLAMVEAPAQVLERHLAVHRLQHVELARGGGIEGRVLTERPAEARQVLHHFGEVLLHHAGRRHRPVLGEIGGVACRVKDVLARADHAVVVVALAHLHQLRPRAVVLDLLARRLGEQLVADAQRELVVGGELGNGGVVVREVLPAAAGVDHAGDAEPVVLAHEMPCRGDLLLGRKARHPQPDRHQAGKAGGRHDQAGGRAAGVALDVAAEELRALPSPSRARGSPRG